MSSWAEERTLQRISDTLERIEKLLERMAAAPRPIVPNPEFPATYDPNRCGFCGSYHGGAICPHLKPTSIT